MQPQILGAAKIGQRQNIVAGAGIDRSRGGDDAERLQAVGAILPNFGAKLIEIHGEVFVGTDAAQRIAAEPEQFERLRDAGMSFVRHIAGETRAVEAVTPHIFDGAVARRREPEKVRHRTAGNEQAARGLFRKAEPLPHPIDDTLFDVNGAVIASAAIGVHGGCRHFGEHAARCAGAVDPAPEPRMRVAGAIRQDQFAKLGSNLMNAARLARWRLRQVPLHAVRHRRPNRPVIGLCKPGNQPVEKRMRIVTEGAPVRWVERRMRDF
jgi:hypothetical protein